MKPRRYSARIDNRTNTASGEKLTFKAKKIWDYSGMNHR